MMSSRRRLLGALCAGSVGLLLTSSARAQHGHAGGLQVPAQGDAVLVFAAATLKPALDEIIHAYRPAAGSEPKVAYGPTPVLAKNIVDGAPADVFFSADTMWMDYLADRKLIKLHSRVDVVRNEVVLVQPAGQTPSQAASRPAMVDGSFPIAKIVGAGPIAMCNPDSHPAGRFSKASLESLGLWSAIADKVAIVENPQVAVTMVARGDVPAAVVFATDAHGVAGVRISGLLPAPPHIPIVYPAAITAAATHPDEAARFLAFLTSPQAREIFLRFGYR